MNVNTNLYQKCKRQGQSYAKVTEERICTTPVWSGFTPQAFVENIFKIKSKVSCKCSGPEKHSSHLSAGATSTLQPAENQNGVFPQVLSSALPAGNPELPIANYCQLCINSTFCSIFFCKKHIRKMRWQHRASILPR